MEIILFTDVADTIVTENTELSPKLGLAGYTCQIIDLFSFYSYDQSEKIIDKFITMKLIKWK